MRSCFAASLAPLTAKKFAPFTRYPRFFGEPRTTSRALAFTLSLTLTLTIAGERLVFAQEMSTTADKGATSVPIVENTSLAGRQDAIPPAPPPIRSVRVLNANALPIEDLIEAARAAAMGRQGDSEAIQAAVEAVIAVYRQRGFSVAQVVEAEVSQQGVLTLKVAEGTIRRIIIRGNTRTKTRTILAALSTRTGDVYRSTRVADERSRLARLGIFEDVQISAEVPGTPEEPAPNKPAPATTPPNVTTPPTGETASDAGTSKFPTSTTTQTGTVPPPIPPTTPPTSPTVPAPPPVPTGAPITPGEDFVGQVDLIVRVKEQPTVNIAATVGYSDGTGAVGFVDVSEDNLLGTAQRVALTWQRTTQANLEPDGTITSSDSRAAVSFSYLVPSLRPGAIGFGLEVYDKNTVFLPFFAGGQETIRSYERRKGGRAQIGTALNSRFSAALTARRDQVGYDAIPDRLNPPLDALDTASGTVGALGVELIADGRDAAENPSRGFRHSFSVERAAGFFGGNRTFTQAILDLRQYLPLRGRQNKTPASSGERRLPSVFALRVLGATSNGDVPLSEQFFLGGFDLLRGYDLFSIRGDRMLLATAEVRIPIGNGLQGVAFTESGGAWQPGRQFALSDMRGSVGLGLRFLSPIGPIRLDAAYGSRFQTYISLGQSF
jgi:outer membrane protein assembly factor BamA